MLQGGGHPPPPARAPGGSPQSATGRPYLKASPCSQHRRCLRHSLLHRPPHPAPPSRHLPVPEPKALRLLSGLGPARLPGRWCPSARKPSFCSPRTQQLLRASACCAKAARGSARRQPRAWGLQLGRGRRARRLRTESKLPCSGRGVENAPAPEMARQVRAWEHCQIAFQAGERARCNT